MGSGKNAASLSANCVACCHHARVKLQRSVAQPCTGGIDHAQALTRRSVWLENNATPGKCRLELDNRARRHRDYGPPSRGAKEVFPSVTASWFGRRSKEALTSPVSARPAIAPIIAKRRRSRSAKTRHSRSNMRIAPMHSFWDQIGAIISDRNPAHWKRLKSVRCEELKSDAAMVSPVRISGSTSRFSPLRLASYWGINPRWREMINVPSCPFRLRICVRDPPKI